MNIQIYYVNIQINYLGMKKNVGTIQMTVFTFDNLNVYRLVPFMYQLTRNDKNTSSVHEIYDPVALLTSINQ